MWTLLSFTLFTIIINHYGAEAVLSEHESFKQFNDYPQFKRLLFDGTKGCQCGKELVNQMALVHFKEKTNNEVKLKRYLVSAKQLAQGGFAKVK